MLDDACCCTGFLSNGANAPPLVPMCVASGALGASEFKAQRGRVANGYHLLVAVVRIRIRTRDPLVPATRR